MRMEPTKSSETLAINVTWTPGTYPKDNKLQLEHGESLKSRRFCFIHTRSDPKWAHPALCKMGTGVPLLKAKSPDGSVSHTPPSSDDGKNE